MDTQSGIARDKRNLVFFIISYVVNNLVSGVLYDTYINYLQEVSPTIATSFWSFYGYATFIGAALLILVPKSGYKKLLIFCSLACTSSMFAVIYTSSAILLYATTLLSLVGVQLHYIMLGPYVAAYTERFKNKSIDWYTRVYYMGYVGYFLSTYLGGTLVVKMFSLRAGITYSEAASLTEYVTELTGDTYNAYLAGNKDVLLMVGIISLLSLIPVLFIKEQKSDYSSFARERDTRSFKEKFDGYRKLLLNRDIACYLAYWCLISFAMGLFTSYYTVYLNRNLHIAKDTASLMTSISYLAIVVFMLFAPKAARKMGQVGSIVFTMLMSIPFMVIIGLGDLFGTLMVPVVGIAMFIRAGLANLSSPMDSSLAMSIVPKNLRPAFISELNFLTGIVSILSGWFTGSILFVTQAGYRYAYFIAAALYAASAVVLGAGLWKKYNRISELEEAKEPEASEAEE